jgi:hypothetical protein
MKVKIKFVIQDMWIGLYWKHHREISHLRTYHAYAVYVCVLPCLHIIISWTTTTKNPKILAY